MTATPLDLSRFLKVVRLAATIPHEDSQHARNQREVAWGLAERLAGRAGLTLDEALSKLDGEDGGPFFRPAPPPPEHPWERTLREALAGHRIAERGRTLAPDELSAETLRAVRGAIPWPSTMREAIAEETAWDEIARELSEHATPCQLGHAAELRIRLLRDFIEGVAETPEDMVARARWLARKTAEGGFAYSAFDPPAVMAADLARMLDMLNEARSARGAPVQDQHSAPTDTAAGPPSRITNREKREKLHAVLSEPGADALSLREVARRAGVSVQSAANYRKAMG